MEAAQHIQQVFTGFLWQDFPSEGSLIIIAEKQKTDFTELGEGDKDSSRAKGSVDHPHAAWMRSNMVSAIMDLNCNGIVHI